MGPEIDTHNNLTQLICVLFIVSTFRNGSYMYMLYDIVCGISHMYNYSDYV